MISYIIKTKQMKKVLNKVTVYLVGIECYPEPGNEYIPTFRTVYPDNYDPYDCNSFNNWAMNIHTSLRTR
mgnify:FL=1